MFTARLNKIFSFLNNIFTNVYKSCNIVSMSDKKILIISTGNIASTVYTLPLAGVLKNYGYSVDYVVSEKGFSVINKNPKVNRVFLMSMERWSGQWLNTDTWEAFFKVINRIKAVEYNIVIDCQQDIRSTLTFAMCNGKRKLTYSDAKDFSKIGGNEFLDSKTNIKENSKNKVIRNLNFLRYLKLEFTDIVFPLPEPEYTYVLRYNRLWDTLDKDKKTIIISAGARNENKRWSVANWKTLIDRIKSKYNLIFTGSTMDKPFVKEIGGEGFLDLRGETRVESFIELLRHADLVITSETETAALAWAVQKPKIITIFTCSDPEKYSPIDMNDPNKYKSLYGNLDCQPCGSGLCLDDVARCRKYPSVDDVIRAIEN